MIVPRVGNQERNDGCNIATIPDAKVANLKLLLQRKD